MRWFETGRSDMAFTFVLRYPDAQERSIQSDISLSVDRIVELRPPLLEADVVAEATRLYATGKTPTTATLTKYRVSAVSQEPRELVYGKLELITVIDLEAKDAKP